MPPKAKNRIKPKTPNKALKFLCEPREILSPNYLVKTTEVDPYGSPLIVHKFYKAAQKRLRSYSIPIYARAVIGTEVVFNHTTRGTELVAMEWEVVHAIVKEAARQVNAKIYWEPQYDPELYTVITEQPVYDEVKRKTDSLDDRLKNLGFFV